MARAPRNTLAAPASSKGAGAASVGSQLGAVARRVRESHGLTLTDVATTAGISAGMLSRLETGRVTPSLETLVALAGALGVRPALLLQEIGDDDTGAQRVPAGQGLEVVRRGTRRGHTYHLLAAHRGPKKSFEPFLITLTDKSEVFPGFQHPGTEFMYMLAGSMTYRHGSQTFPLGARRLLEFSRRRAARPRVPGEGADSVLVDHHLRRGEIAHARRFIGSQAIQARNGGNRAMASRSPSF